MVVWGLGRPYRWDFLTLFFKKNSLFERALRTFYQHLTCHIWKDDEIVVKQMA